MIPIHFLATFLEKVFFFISWHVAPALRTHKAVLTKVAVEFILHRFHKSCVSGRGSSHIAAVPSCTLILLFPWLRCLLSLLAFQVVVPYIGGIRSPFGPYIGGIRTPFGTYTGGFWSPFGLILSSALILRRSHTKLSRLLIEKQREIQMTNVFSDQFWIKFLKKQSYPASCFNWTSQW